MKAIRPLWLAVAGIVCLALISVDSAESGEAKKAKKGFGGGDALKKLDTNNDGKISKDEFSKFGGGKLAGKTDQIFNKLDADGDGFISQAELAKAKEIFSQFKKKKE